MKLSEFLSEKQIITDLGPCNKLDALERLVATAQRVITELEKKKVIQVLMEREELGSTGIGGGVAIPHGRLAQLKRLKIFVGISREGVDFDAIDNSPVNIIFLLLAPDDSATIYLKVLARVSKLLKREGTLERFLAVDTSEEILAIIEEVDSMSI